MHETTESDGQLMARIAARDEAAFQRLVRMHGQRLSTFIGRLTGWHTDVEDLLQETLLKVWDNAHKYNERGSLLSWLMQIAVNRVKNHFRATNRLKRHLENFAKFKYSSVPTAVAPHSSATELDPALAQALQQISLADRKLIVMYYLEELPADQLSQTENISLETLHVRLHRARNRLKQQLLELEMNPHERR